MQSIQKDMSLEDFGTKRCIGKIVRTFPKGDFCDDLSYPSNEIKQAVLKKFEEQYHEIPDEYTVNIVSEGSSNEWKRLIITGYKSE